MPEHLLVSIIIPCHNRIVELLECLNSVAQQTYEPIEVIVVDDASDENIVKAASSISWPKGISWRYVRSEKNQGPGASREMGRQLAQGQFISYLDSDDICDKRKYEVQVQALLDNPEAGMCYCAAQEFTRWPPTGKERIWGRSGEQFSRILPHILYARPWGTGACLWTRDAVELIGPWSSRWYSEDVEYDSRAGCLKIALVHAPDILFYVRRSDVNSERLTQGSNQFRVVERAHSLLTIAQNLEDYACLDSSKNRWGISLKLFNQALLLVSIKEYRLLAATINKMITINPWSWSTIFQLKLLYWSTPFLPPSWSVRFGRRLRRKIFRKEPSPLLSHESSVDNYQNISKALEQQGTSKNG